MTTYGVTAATGQLGTMVVDSLIAKGVEPGSIIAIVRDLAKATALATRGVAIRVADYNDRAALEDAFAGVDRVLFISGSDVGQRVTQHRNVIDAAKASGVGRLYYTSVLRAADNPMILAPEHKVTEQMLAESGVPHTILRHGWYTENYTADLPEAVSRGVLAHAAGDGLISAAPRSDFAEADAQAMITDYDSNVTLEMGGAKFTYADLAEAAAKASGATIAAKNLPVDDFRQMLVQNGVGENTAGFLATLQADVAAGYLDGDSADLLTLLGRPVTPLTTVVRAGI